MCSIQYSRVDSLAVDENCSGVLIFCLFVQKMEAKLDPITDIFRTMHVTAFGLHRLEATAPWGGEQEKQTEEKVTPSDKKMSPTDLAHFAMLSTRQLLAECGRDSRADSPHRWRLLFAGPGDFDCFARQPANTSEVEFPRDRGQGQQQCRSLWRWWRTDDNRLWVLQFRSRQPEADHSVIAQLHSD